jgi:hypothetical protein
MKKLIRVLAAAAVAGGFSAQALAVGQLADVTVTDRSTGTTLPVHYYRGEYWVAGSPGAKYAIDIRNTSSRRVLAVTSVDGVNVVSGETANTAQTGYVFGAWQRYDITGWRKSNNAVAAFEFTASPNSYAERTGRPRDVGVIGVALFRERVVAPPPPVSVYPSRPRHYDESYGDARKSAPSAAATAPSAAPQADSAAESSKDSGARAEALGGLERESSSSSAAKRSAPQSATAPAPKLGTGHGERESSYVSNTEFERQSSTPAEVIRIRYDSYANLMAMGVVPTPRPVQPRPNPFPDGAVGYAPDPPHWR